MIRVAGKPLSVNKAYKHPKGYRRLKTKEAKNYVNSCMKQMPYIDVPHETIFVVYEFGVSNPRSDTDNCVKLFQDALQKRYKFDDHRIEGFLARKKVVDKGNEYIKYKLYSSADEILKDLGVI